MSRVASLGLCALLLCNQASAAAPASAQAHSMEISSQAEAAYRAGRFSEAARLLAEAYRLNAEPIILYNLARALEGKGDRQGALDAYRRYLKDASEVSDRRLIEGRIAGLEHQLADEAALRLRVAEQERGAIVARQRAEALEARAQADRAHLAAEERERRQRDRRRFIAAWSLAGVGGLALLTGASLGGAELTRRDDADSAPNAVVADQRYTSAQHLALGANVCLGIGGVLATAGLAWGIVESVRHRRSAHVETAALTSAAAW